MKMKLDQDQILNLIIVIFISLLLWKGLIDNGLFFGFKGKALFTETARRVL